MLVIACVAAYAYVNVGMWLLIVNPEPVKIDLVFSFAGGPYREDHAVELLKKHPEAKWLASTGSRGLIIEKCRKAGIDTARVTTIDTCKSTWGEVEVLKAHLKTDKLVRTVGLVSSEWHMRRITLTIFRQGGVGAKVACLPVALEVSGPERVTFNKWKKTGATKEIVESEIVKTVYYILGLRQ